MIFMLSDLATLQDKDIDDLSYKATSEIKGQITTSSNSLSKGNKGWIRALISFIKYLNMNSEEDFENIDINQFNTYRLSIYNPDNLLRSNSSTSTRSRNSSNQRGNNDSLTYFKQRIKRDKSQYGILKEDKQWDSWNRSTKATARSHDCEDIFNENYIPSSSEDKQLFLEKQNFIYSVFEDKIQTNMGRHLVRKYEKTYDAQSIYAELVAYAKESTQASIEASNILSYLTTVKLHKIAWKGTYHAFILHWINKLRLYEEMVPFEDHFTNSVKKTLLENTVMGVPILRNVKNQADHDKAHGKAPLSYDNYLTILLSAAATHDADSGYRQRGKLNAYSTSHLYGASNDTHNLQYDIELHDIDTECLFEHDQEIYQTYQRTTNNIRIQKDK